MILFTASGAPEGATARPPVAMRARLPEVDAAGGPAGAGVGVDVVVVEVVPGGGAPRTRPTCARSVATSPPSIWPSARRPARGAQVRTAPAVACPNSPSA